MTDKQRKYLESLIRKVFRNADSQNEILSRLDRVQISSRQASAMIHALRLECNISCSVPSYMLVASNLNPRMDEFFKIIVQCFGKEDEDDKHIVHPLNFMPRKERCCELDYDLSDKGQKEKYLKQLRDSQERLKILSLLLHKQEEEVIEFGYPKTTCYYPDLNCLKEIDFKEDKQ